jgi:hypothetical protein
MAPITPWLAPLVETELENVIAWKSIVKPDPGASDEHRSRFSDDGSNLRSVVGPPSLDSDSTIQLLEVSEWMDFLVLRCSLLTTSQKPGSNARAKIPISDGDVSVLAILSDTAWDAYDKGLEESEEPRKGDLILCKKITVISTTYGPSEERVKLRIEDLELTGNFRKIIGQPTSLLQRAPIAALRERIEDLRLKQLQSEVPLEDQEDDAVIKEGEEEDAGDDDEDEIEDAPGNNEEDEGVHDQASAAHEEDPPGTTSEALQNAIPTIRTQPQGPREQVTTVSETSPRHLTSPAIPNKNSMAQIETQLPLEALQTQAPPQPRNPLRRTRGGFSMGREGFEPTRGDNLAGPQAPTLHARQASLSPEPPRNKLLDVLSKLPAKVPRKRSPESSAPVSTQVVMEQIVVETPTKPKRSTATSTGQDSTPAPRKRYRIPRDQRALLDHPSSWIPSAPGQEFPHPNVPVGLLKAWNTKATGTTNPTSQSSPSPSIEQSSANKSLEVVQPDSQATAAAEPEEAEPEDDSESEASDTSEDKPLSGWSESPSRSQMLPPDSSVAHMSPRTSRAGSRDELITGSEHMPISIGDDAQRSSSERRRTIPRVDATEGQLPRRKHSVGSQVDVNSSRQNNTQTPNGARASCRERNRANQREKRGPLEDDRSYGAIARRIEARHEMRPSATPRASQSIPVGPRNSQPLADNHHGPVRASTQQTPDRRRISFDPRDHGQSSTNISPPSRVGTGPRTSASPHYGIPDRRNPNLASDWERTTSGDFYGPSPSGSRGGGGLLNNRRPLGGTPTSSSTAEMETGAPRALPPSKYHQDRRDFYRDAQRRDW